MPIAIGVDIGGSHISCAAVELKTSEIINQTYCQEHVDSKAEKEVILKCWGNCINKVLGLLDDKEIIGIGFAMPGPFRYKEGIAMFEVNDKFESLYNVSIAEELPKYLLKKDLPLRFFNDASSFGIGSMLTGGFDTQSKVLALTLGTGFGAAFFEDEYPLIHAKHVPENGCLWDKQFKDSIADDYFSTRWFLQEFEKEYGQTTANGVKGLIEVDRSRAKGLFEKFVENFVAFTTPFLREFSPDILIIGGSIAKSSQLFLENLQSKLVERDLDIQIKIIDHTEQANIIGASHTFNSNFWSKIKDKLPNI